MSLNNHLFLISQNIIADLKGPSIKYRLHYDWCTGRRFTAATRHNTSCSEVKSEMRSFKSNENIHKKEGGSYYVVSANKASSVTLQSPGNESQRKHTAILRISNRQSIQRLI